MIGYKKSWGEIFRAALHRGDDHGYAAYLADNYISLKESESKQHNKPSQHTENGQEDRWLEEEC